MELVEKLVLGCPERSSLRALKPLVPSDGCKASFSFLSVFQVARFFGGCRLQEWVFLHLCYLKYVARRGG